MRVHLPFTGPYDWPLALRMIGAHAVPGGERLETDDRSYTRVLPADGSGPPVVLTVRAEHDHVVADVTGDAGGGEQIRARVRHWLDLDLDPARPRSRFADDERLGPLVRARPGLRRIRYPASYEAVISTVLGQQVSLAAARTFAGRFAAAYGSPAPQGLTAFPRADRVAEAAVDQLQRSIGITGSRARTIQAVSLLMAETGDWPVPLPPPSWDSVAARLQALPGIGPWTVAYLRMRLFGDPDAVPLGDLVLRRALGVGKDRDVAAVMEPWRPERTYATFHVWASTSW